MRPEAAVAATPISSSNHRYSIHFVMAVWAERNHVFGDILAALDAAYDPMYVTA